MIKKLEQSSIDEVMNIWLNTNIDSHHYINPDYWKSNFDIVKKLFPQAEVYVYEIDTRIIGFIGLNKTYIEGLFVCKEEQSKGIGKKLLDYAKGIKSELTLNVYQKNVQAIMFYQREGFEIQGESIDANTNEKEYLMKWSQ